MQKYQNNVQNTSGDAVAGASVRVVNYPAGTLASIYSDNGVTPVANPLTTDRLGEFSFYAANGRYSLEISGQNFVGQTLTDIALADPFDREKVDTFIAGADFVPGITTQLTLSRTPSNADHVEVFFDPLYQGLDQWTLNGNVVTFGSPIPIGTTKVFIRISV
ncbi:carboxypeptidase regulatory-like domain-containing protein [Cupriavidus taiwanensis]|uniref:carboxypeptidase-like regulatory domain-containing protein n=1 Tax=Cupriavidus taiwanensis TaxID=164546 RepID=UPI00157320F2|nr:carboxypeptidase-like regulatory domain-containing protein [Cupriavidus taiwanensis]NSX16934.1 carboxypeptidase regulatory-like domain-containing protein [Cupriavidus taiwanensis]